MKVLILSILVLMTARIQAQPQELNPKVQNPLSYNECFAKGGIGIIDTGLYIALRSDRNQLILADGKKWTGQDAAVSETVIVYKGQTLQGSTPDRFALSEATIVSFEKDRVRFFDFKHMDGGFYRRRPYKP